MPTLDEINAVLPKEFTAVFAKRTSYDVACNRRVLSIYKGSSHVDMPYNFPYDPSIPIDEYNERVLAPCIEALNKHAI